RDAQATRYILFFFVTSHRCRSRPRKVLVQDFAKLLVAREPDIFERSIEAGDGALIHLLVRPVAAVHSNDGGLRSVSLGVRTGSAERLRPVCGEALRVLWVVAVAERVGYDLVLQHAGMPGARQSEHPVATACGFVNRLRGSVGMHETSDCAKSLLIQYGAGIPRPSSPVACRNWPVRRRSKDRVGIRSLSQFDRDYATGWEDSV